MEIVTVALMAWAGSLPWTESVYARESSSSEYSARYQTETSLRGSVDRLRYRCRNDRGEFTHYESGVTCYKSGVTYSCSANATASCRKREA